MLGAFVCRPLINCGNYMYIDNNSNLDSDALNALMNLGFKSRDITKVLNKIDKDCSLEDKIKLALKELR